MEEQKPKRKKPNQGKQQAETGRFQDVPLFPPAGRAVQAEAQSRREHRGGEGGERGGTVDGAAGAAMATSAAG